MKKMFRLQTIIWGVAALLAYSSLLACGSLSSAGKYTAARLNNVPDFVNDAYQNASDDVLIGIGRSMKQNGPCTRILLSLILPGSPPMIT